MGPCVWRDDGSRERYCEGSSEGSPAREFPVSSDYHQCQYQIMARDEPVDVRHR